MPDGAQAGAVVWGFRNTGYSSARFGDCEICGLRVAEVFVRVEARYQGGDVVKRHGGDGAFGHEACLRKAAG